MLSIRFGPEREWWVSGKTFHQLFQSALETGEMPPHLEHWRDVADANGGFDVSGMAPAEADRLVTALHRAAKREMAHLGSGSPTPEAASYCLSLAQLIRTLTP
jgi:hypothetical protein